MGAWATGITSDDTVSDVVDSMVSCLKAGGSLKEATEAALLAFRESLNDADDGPLVWIGIAHTQWKYGALQDDVLRRVREDVVGQRGLERWRDDSSQLRKREAVLIRFLEKISVPNPRPSSSPKVVARAAPFSIGDCLSILTSDSRYTAAIVLGVDNSRAEYGSNLVASLDYLSDSPPSAAVFEQRMWLYKHHGNWNGEQELTWLGPHGFKKERTRFTVLCQTKLRFFDPKRSNSYGSWASLGTQILLCRAASEA